MAYFNEKINSETGYIMCDQDFFIYRAEAMKEFERNIDDDLYYRTNPYRLVIQYKTTHRVKKMAGRCFLWDNSHGDHMKDPGNGIELRSMNDASQDDCEGFGNPRFDGMEAAILITDRYVFIYGDVQIEAAVISLDKKHMYCDVSLCGSIVSNFRIPAKAFDRLFGLKENFLKRNDKECECVEVSFADSEEGEQDEADEKTTEYTACERITNDRKFDSYHKRFGFDFFDTNKCLRDIDRVRYGVGSMIAMMQHVLQILDEAQDNIDRNSNMTNEALALLRESETIIDDARKDSQTCIDEMANVIRKSIKERINTA